MSDTLKVKAQKISLANATPTRSLAPHLYRSALRPVTEAPVTAQGSTREDITSPCHNYGRIRVHCAATSCLLGLAAPRAYPFGRLCHPCRAHVQAKLTVSQPGDKYEEEADRVADMVMSMPEPCPECSEKPGEEVQTKPAADQITPFVQRQVEPEENEKEAVQAKPSTHRPATIPSPLATYLQSLPGGGLPLAESARTFFEPRFGHDFSHVRVHADAKAAESAQSVNAVAYTLGSHVVFGAGQYTPASSTGIRLLAHELTHVVQQDRGGHSTQGEIQADATALRLASGYPMGEQSIGGHPIGLYRQTTGREVEEMKKPVKKSEEVKFDVPPEKATPPEMPSRIPIPWLSKGSFSLGLRLGFEEFSSRSEFYKAWLEATGDPIKQALQRAKIMNYMLTGKVPTGWEETDKGQLARAIWGIFANNIAPRLANKIIGALSTRTGPGGVSYEADLILITDFSKEIGGGLSFTLRW